MEDECLVLNVKLLKFGASWPYDVGSTSLSKFLYRCYKEFFRLQFVVLTTSILLYCFFAYETLEDLAENISVFLTQAALSGRFYSLVVHKEKMLNIIKTVSYQFYIPTEKEKKIVESKIKLTKKLSKGTFYLYIGTTLAMVCYPFTSTERVLPFKTWFPYIDESESPYYEILYLSQAVLTIIEGWFAGAMDAFCIVMLIYGALQFQLIAQGLRNSKTENDLRTCIQYHQDVLSYAKEVESFLSPIFNMQVTLDSLLICVLGFHILTMEIDGIKILRVILHLVCTIFQLWFMCYFGTQYTSESALVYEAAYQSNWYTQSSNFRRMIWMITERARKPAAIKAGLLGNLALPLFAGIIRQSYSYMALLRQFEENQ